MSELNKKHKILVVDDVRENIDILMTALKDRYKMAAALTGEKALKQVRSAKPPDLILLDVMMPEMDGFEVCRRLKADPQTKHIPVIFLTAMQEIENEARGLEVGAADYVTKPFNPALVRARVKNHLSLKMHQDLLTEMVRQRTAQLEAAYERIKSTSLDTIFRLSKAAEFRDEDTGAHIQRMSHYSAAIARRIGLKQKTVDSILYASAMHDVGKIGIPDRILTKPGRLTAAEFETMKQHTVIGGSILAEAKAEYLQLGRVIALGHHEKWDGSGYPQGLKYDAIPLAACICAVADVFDALASERPYKAPLPLEKVLEIIKAESGRHFHPEVVSAFFDITDELFSIKTRYADDTRSHLMQIADPENDRDAP